MNSNKYPEVKGFPRTFRGSRPYAMTSVWRNSGLIFLQNTNVKEGKDIPQIFWHPPETVSHSLFSIPTAKAQVLGIKY